MCEVAFHFVILRAIYYFKAVTMACTGAYGITQIIVLSSPTG